MLDPQGTVDRYGMAGGRTLDVRGYDDDFPERGNGLGQDPDARGVHAVIIAQQKQGFLRIYLGQVGRRIKSG